jgi:hypothetical protein
MVQKLHAKIKKNSHGDTLPLDSAAIRVLLTDVHDRPDAVWWEVLIHPACTLNFSLQDFHFFGPLKKAQKPYMCRSL